MQITELRLGAGVTGVAGWSHVRSDLPDAVQEWVRWSPGQVTRCHGGAVDVPSRVGEKGFGRRSGRHWG